MLCSNEQSRRTQRGINRKILIAQGDGAKPAGEWVGQLEQVNLMPPHL
jgi:hypothetical protein